MHGQSVDYVLPNAHIVHWKVLWSNGQWEQGPQVECDVKCIQQDY